MKKTQHKILRILDWSGLIIVIIVQIGVMTVSMMRIAPGPLETIGLVISGIAIVLFAPRAFAKFVVYRKPRYIINYIMLELVTLFFGWSFVLSATFAQTDSFAIDITPQNDVVLLEYYDQRDRIEQQLVQRREEFDQSVRAETIQNIQNEQQQLQEELRSINSIIQIRLQAIADGTVTQQARERASRLSAEQIFQAIPNAIEEGRHIQVVVWFIFTGSISLMIINALADEVAVQIPKKKRRTGWLDFLKSKKTPDKKSRDKKSWQDAKAAKPISFVNLPNS